MLSVPVYLDARLRRMRNVKVASYGLGWGKVRSKRQMDIWDPARSGPLPKQLYLSRSMHLVRRLRGES